MRSRRAISASRWLFAVTASMLFHAAVVGGWFTVKPAGVGQSEPQDTCVNAPADDDVTTITLRDSPRIFQAIVKPVLPPADLPKAVVGNPGTNQDITPVTGHAPETGTGSTPGLEAPKLHGRVKAGKCVVYVLDCSSSMGPALSRAKVVVRESLRQVGPDAKFLIVAYNGGATGCFPVASLADGDHLAAADRWLTHLTAEGRSDHLKGVREALAAKPDAVFLLTDADDFDEKEMKTLSALVPAGVFVNAAIFGRPPAVTGYSPLEQFTRRRSGSVRWYPGP